MERQIKTGIASFGMSGKVFHAPLLQANPGFEIKVIVERSKNLSKELYPNTFRKRSFEELLRDEKIELVIVNTPDYLHYEQTKQALMAGKHVVVEKPFCQKYEDCIELIELAKKKGLVLSVFQNRRWDGDFLTVQKLIKENKLGRLVAFESHFDRYRNFIQENTWKEETSSGSGIVYNLGSHLIDQVVVLFGSPKAVFAEIKCIRTNGKTDDYFDISLEYGENISVLVRGSMLVKEPGPRYILHGTEGSFLKWGTDPQEQQLKDGKIPGQSGWGIEDVGSRGIISHNENGMNKRDNFETLPGNYQNFYDGIYNAIRNGSEVPVNPADAALVIRIINAAFQSKIEGRKIHI